MRSILSYILYLFPSIIYIYSSIFGVFPATVVNSNGTESETDYATYTQAMLIIFYIEILNEIKAKILSFPYGYIPKFVCLGDYEYGLTKNSSCVF